MMMKLIRSLYIEADIEASLSPRTDVVFGWLVELSYILVLIVFLNIYNAGTSVKVTFLYCLGGVVCACEVVSEVVLSVCVQPVIARKYGMTAVAFNALSGFLDTLVEVLLYVV